MFFCLLGQLGEFGVEWVIVCQERFFAVEDGRVRAGLVFEAIDFAGAEGERDAAEQGGVGVGFEAGLVICETFLVWWWRLIRLAPYAFGFQPSQMGLLARRVSRRGFTFEMSLLFPRASRPAAP